MTFREKLLAAARTNDSLLCVGLDIVLSSLPAPLPRTVESVVPFNRAIVEATADLVCAYKPNLAFYEALGQAGLEALARTLELIPKHIPVIGDAKRGDIGHTAQAYARALFETFGFDAVTVNPYLGRDALQPFLDYADRGVFVLCRTSNPGAVDFQDLSVGGKPLYQVVAEKVVEWDRHGNAGLVVGATYPDEISLVRGLAPELPLLVPGVGAQAGDVRAAVAAAVDARGELAVVNSSRQVIYAANDARFAEAARSAALTLKDEINRARGLRPTIMDAS
jgi:orotidine-5'-phosphate decarboxylase